MQTTGEQINDVARICTCRHISCRLQVLLCHTLLSIDQVLSVKREQYWSMTFSHDQEALFNAALQLSYVRR